MARFLADMQVCFQELIDNQQSHPVGVELDDKRVPKIHIPGEMSTP